MRKIILNLGAGTLAGGCPAILGEILGDSSATTDISRFYGQLPASPALAAAYHRWQQLYTARNQDLSLRIQLLEQEGLRYSDTSFKQHCTELVDLLNEWLNAPEFLPIDRALRSELARTGDTRIILETSDPQLQKLPWHLWQLLDEYPSTELSFSAFNWVPLQPQATSAQRARILATFGNSEGLDLAADLSRLHTLPDAEVTVLEAPKINQLHEALWQPQGWDIFFFAGHSKTQGRTGVIDLNATERLTVEQIRYALSKAIKNGLKIAIFNSCDGLGLAQELADLQIPYVVVMREPVPDYVAQQFLHYLLTAFAAGQSFHLAVGEARQRLAGLDSEVPCASWLPIIWQNPMAPVVCWKDFQKVPASASTHQRWKSPLFKSFLVGAFMLGLRALRLLEPWELTAYDHLMRSRPAEPVDARIVVVEASEETTSQYGYPLPDEVLTTIIDKINESEPLAIGLDLHRGKPRPTQGAIAERLQLQQAQLASSTVSNTSDAARNTASEMAAADHSDYTRLLQQIEQTPNLFLVCAYSSTDENYQAPSQLSERSRLEQVGFSDLPIDRQASRLSSRRGDLSPAGQTGLVGAIVRRHLLSYDPGFSETPSTCTTPYSFSFQIAFQYLSDTGVVPLEVTPDEHWRFGPVVFHSLPKKFGGYQGLETSSSQVLLNYRDSQPAQKISVEQLISGNFDPSLLQDRIVLVGYNAPVSKDYFETPYGPMSGLWIHTHMVSQLISSVLDQRPLIRTLPYWESWQWGDMLWILAWAGAGGYASWALAKHTAQYDTNTQYGVRSKVLLGLWLLMVSSGALLLYSICWLAMIGGVWLPLVPSGLAALGSSALVHVKTKSRTEQPHAPLE
ncbi:MAG: CHASE2 domain-containing protein [Cyanobacteria bacterium J06597_16]